MPRNVPVLFMTASVLGRGTRRPVSVSRLDGSQLEDPEPGAGVLRRDLEGLVEVGALQDVEAGDVTLVVGDGPVTEDRLARSNANRPALGEGAEHVALKADTATVHLLAPVRHRRRDSRPFLWVELDARIPIRKKHVLHRPSSARCRRIPR